MSSSDDKSVSSVSNSSCTFSPSGSSPHIPHSGTSSTSSGKSPPSPENDSSIESDTEPEKKRQRFGLSKRHLRRKRATEQELNKSGYSGGVQALDSDSRLLHGGNSPNFAECNNDSDTDITSEESGASSPFQDSESEVSSNNSDHSQEPSDSSDPDNELRTESVDYLYDGSEVTSNEALVKILQLYINERWTKTSLDKSIRLTKELLPQPNGLPSSGKEALKQLKLLTTTCSESVFSYCTDCQQLSGNCNHDKGCINFYSLSIQDQVKHMFEHRNLASLIESYNSNNREDGSIADIRDGSEFKEVKKLLPNKFDLMLNWNTDGLALSSSSNQEMWLLLCTICELPPHLRSSFLLVGGVYVGKKKPNMNVFLKPFADQLQELWEVGVSWMHPTSKEAYVSKIAAPSLSADAPATALVVNMKNHNSRFGCNTCEQKTKKIPLSAKEIEFNRSIADKRKKKKRKRRFVFEEVPANLRSGPRMDLLGQFAEIRGKSRKGVVGRAVASSIPHFDRASGVCGEYLHLILLGVVKYLLLIIFFERGPWYLGDSLDEIDQFINENIKVPEYIKRLPRGISEIKFWKASEFRAFLLFYSLPVFKMWLPDEYFQHWLLLVSAIYIFLKDCITEDDIRTGDIMIKSFVRDIGPLYGENCYTYNMHTLLHVPLFVRRWGPLWATSAFVYETFNGFVSNNIHGTKHLGKELINNIQICQSLSILENIVSSRRSEHGHSADQEDVLLLGASLTLASLSTEEKDCLNSYNFTVGNLVLHARAKIRSCIYTTEYYDEDKKRSNSFVEFKSSNSEQLMYGQIVVFVRAENASVHCLVKVFKVIHTKMLFHQQSRHVVRHLIPVEYSENYVIFPVQFLEKKVLKAGIYLGIAPNKYEINL